MTRVTRQRLIVRVTSEIGSIRSANRCLDNRPPFLLTASIIQDPFGTVSIMFRPRESPRNSLIGVSAAIPLLLAISSRNLKGKLSGQSCGIDN